MPTVQVTVHPRGLHPVEAARAWQLHKEEGMRLEDVCDEVVNMAGETPSKKAVWRAIQMVQSVRSSHAVPQTKYSNCGRRRALAP